MKKCVYLAIIILYLSCTKNIPTETNNNELLLVPVETTIMIEPNYNQYGTVEIKQSQLDISFLSSPSSLVEISNKLTEYDRNNITFISIVNGKRIASLEGLELFPSLETLNIYNSNIVNFSEINTPNTKLRELTIESKTLNDISNIIFFENIQSLYLLGSDNLSNFPDITNLTNLRNLSLQKCKNIDYSNISDKLPENIKIIDLSDCDIISLDSISKLFTKNITHFNLSNNLIHEISYDIDYGNATYIYLSKCPVEANYFSWDEPISDVYPGRIKINNVLFAFGYIEDYAWVIND